MHASQVTNQEGRSEEIAAELTATRTELEQRIEDRVWVPQPPLFGLADVSL
jgi:hypothetical protein